MRINKRNLIIKMIVLIVTITVWIICYKINANINSISDLELTKFFLSCGGILLFGFIIYTWYKINDEVLCLYTIFMLFFLLFNYGHCILWAIGIHTDDEIGKKNLYTLGYASNTTVIKTQLIFLSCFISFHLGAIFSNKKKKEKVNRHKLIQKDEIYKVNFILAFIVIPATFLVLINQLRVSSAYGYKALYYGEYANSGSTVLILISKMFVPCLIGLLIGSNCNKKTRYIVYSIYAIYSIILTLCGDRGGWIYGFIILVWLHHKYVKKINLRKMIFFCIIGLTVISVLYAIVSVRNKGITFRNVIDAMKSIENPIIMTLNEMGASMRVQTALVHENYPQYPYGNTYFLALIGMVSERIINITGIKYVGLSTWFSQVYLNIDYGAGFTIIAEAVLNYGPFLAPLVLIILGYIITSTINVNKDDFNNNPNKIIFNVTAMISWFHIIRGTMQNSLKTFFYTTIIYFIMYKIVLNVFKLKIKDSKGEELNRNDN